MNLKSLNITRHNHGEEYLKITGLYKYGYNYLSEIESFIKDDEETNRCVDEIEYEYEEHSYSYKDDSYDTFMDLVEGITEINLQICVACSGKEKSNEMAHTSNYIFSIEEILLWMVQYPVEFTYTQNGGRELTPDEILLITRFYKFVLHNKKINKFIKG